MDEVELFALYYLRQKKRKKKERRCWVHKIVAARPTEGDYYILFPRLVMDPNKFFNYFRMSINSFKELLAAIEPSITKSDTNMRQCISAEEKLALTLRYLATGCSMKDLHYSYRLGVSTVSGIIRDVCKSIWHCLKSECMPVPNKEKWLNIAKGFAENSQFPHCIGAIDGKHFRAIKPKLSGSMYFNYKDYFSIQMLAICDSNYCFTYVDIGNYGKDCDSSIFKHTKFYKKLCAGALAIPEADYISEEKDVKVPFFLVGDEAFELTTSMMRPYGGKYLPTKQRIFNYRLTRARRFIECSFGILTNKWRIFHRPLNVGLELAIDIIKAGVILHNFVRVRDGYKYKDTLTYTGLRENNNNTQPDTINYVGRTPIHIREYLTEFFETEEGEIPWQYSLI